MKTAFQFVKKQWFTIILIGGTLYGVNWAVATLRPPGSMTVIEAQAMDMTAMKAPVGVQPVGTGYALVRDTGGTRTFPATVTALSDEDAKARVAGLVKDVHVYPGDRVKKGQVLATIEADEVMAKAYASQLSAQAAQSQVMTAEAALQASRTTAEQAEVQAGAAEAAVAKARLDAASKASDIETAELSVQTAKAGQEEASVQVKYWQEELARNKELYQGKAISLDELQQAERSHDQAAAKLVQAESQVRTAKSRVTSSAKKHQAAIAEIARLEQVHMAALKSAESKHALVMQAEAQVKASQSSADAARAGSQVSGSIAGYTDVIAADDGVVTERVVSPGTPVGIGQTIVKLKVDRELRIQADLPQSLLGIVHKGIKVLLTANGTTAEAELTTIFPSANPATRTIRVEVLVPKELVELEVGMSVDMDIFVEASSRGLTVPTEALHVDQNGADYVWVVAQREIDPNEKIDYFCTMHPDVSSPGPALCPICKMDLVPRSAAGNLIAEKRLVQKNTATGPYSGIVSGLEEGDEVVLQGWQSIHPGKPIQPVEWGPNGPVNLPGVGGESSHDHEGEDMTDDGGTEQAQAGQYTCPMHPEVVSDEPGICPICKMDLVPVEAEGEHVCPMHPEVVSDGPDTCPICKMDLVPVEPGDNE